MVYVTKLLIIKFIFLMVDYRVISLRVLIMNHLTWHLRQLGAGQGRFFGI